MTDEPRTLEWTRFAGAFANAGQVAPSTAAIVGIAPDKCPCCSERYVVIAAIHPGGYEVSVSLPPAVALQVAHQILDSYAKVSETPESARQ